MSSLREFHRVETSNEDSMGSSFSTIPRKWPRRELEGPLEEIERKKEAGRRENDNYLAEICS